MKEALKLALEALACTDSEPGSRAFEREEEAITAIKEALVQPEPEPVYVSQPEQEPVGCMPHGWVVNWPSPNGGTKPVYHATSIKPKFGAELDGKLTMYPVYTTPPKRPWVELTGLEQKELMAMSAREAVFATETKLKEKNT